MSRDFLIHMDFVFSKMSSPHVDVSGARSTSASKLLSSCRVLDHQIPSEKITVKHGRWYFFSVMCLFDLWSFLLVNLTVICRLWSLRKRRSWSWRDVSSHRADAAEHPYHRSVPRSSWRVSSKAGHRQGRPGWNRKHARSWPFWAIEKAKRVRDADQNQWISMRPLFFALVFTLNSSIFAFPLHFLSLFRGIFLNLSLGVHFARRMKSSPPLMMRVLRWENFENILWGMCEPVRLETCNAHRDIIYKSSNFIADRC